MSSNIYRITNIINSKIYIGQTQRKVKTRWTEHKSHANKGHTNNLLSNAIRKYPSECWIVDTLEVVDNDISDIREKFWIDVFKSNIKENGYNLTEGGRIQYILTEYSRSIMSIKRKNRVTKEITRQRLSEAHKGVNNVMYGKTHSPEARAKISAARSLTKGKKRGPYKKKT
jgi:group I intron endonuclease